MVREIANLVQISIPKNVQLRLELDDQLPPIEADPGQIQQIVMNLVINGAEAIPADLNGTVLVTTGGHQVDEEYLRTLSVDEIPPGLYVALEVHDTGIGMDLATQAKIFDPFFSTKFAGRGLGLAATLGIVRGHKGAIKVYSTPARGTTFKVLFPATESKVRHTPEAAGQKNLRGSGTVLVVDDEEVVRNTARAMLERYGYSVLLAHDGQEAVDLYRAAPDRIAVVLLDLTMPVMGGAEAFRQLRLIRPNVRVILSSGYNEVEAIAALPPRGSPDSFRNHIPPRTSPRRLQRFWSHSPALPPRHYPPDCYRRYRPENPLMAHKRLNRIVRSVNAAIAVMLLVALAAVYWYAYRPLPQTAGSIAAFVSRPASASRDALGVPHIRAATEEDALFVQGYVTAQDRLFQMDGLRRSTAGTLAEIAGPGALASDEESRRLRMRRIAEESYLSMPARDRAVFAAYTRGVNAFISTHIGRLPLSFSVLGYDPRPWSVVDCILVGLHMFRTLTTTSRSDLLKRDMLASGNAGKVNLLFQDRAGSEVQPGSNGWALGGAGPQRENRLSRTNAPGIVAARRMVHGPPASSRAGRGGRVAAGYPGVIVGHNRRIAWGITNLQFDVQDLYIEKIDPTDRPVSLPGATEQARLEREMIRVKGQSPRKFRYG